MSNTIETKVLQTRFDIQATELAKDGVLKLIKSCEKCLPK